MRELVPPEPALRACVVVPARNEEELVGRCLQALADQRSVPPAEYEVILVLDGCTDETETRASEVARRAPDLRLHFLEGPGKGAGHARRMGMEAACSRLLNLGRERGLIASTDADTVVAPDWLAAQLGCVDRGARAIGGRIELSDDEDLPNEVAGWRAERGHRRHMDLLSESASDGEGPRYLEHWQFSGASLALTAEVYREIGGLEPRAALEDEHLERVLRQRSITIERSLSVRVATSARLVGRAERGLARDLALASWFRNNTYGEGSFDAGELLASKKHSVSVALVADGDGPALRTAVDTLLSYERAGLTDETLVVCSGPLTGGLPPGVGVRRAEELMPDFGPVRGYGDVLWRALHATEGEVVVFPEPGSASSLPALLRPLVEREELALVKGFRSSSGASELIARPLINLHYPELAGFVEPLSRSFAARRSLLEALPFPVGDGATLSLLLDAAERAGVNTLAQAALGSHGEAPYPLSAETAYAVQAAAASRTRTENGKELVTGPLFLPTPEGLQTRRVPLEERPPLAGHKLTKAGL